MSDMHLPNVSGAGLEKVYPDRNLRIWVFFKSVTRGMPPKNHWGYEIYRISDNVILAEGVYECDVPRLVTTHVHIADLIASKYPREDRPEMLAEGGFIEKARALVHGMYYSQEPNRLDYGDVYVVWFAKTLQNWKALVSSNAKDDRYYEVTYNGDKRETYIDAYSKVENTVVPDITDVPPGLFAKED